MTSKPGVRHAQEARRIAAVAADHRLAAVRILDDELIDERGIARQRIAEQVLPDAQSHADDLAGLRREGRRLDPHVVGGAAVSGHQQRHGGESRRKSNRFIRSVIVCTGTAFAAWRARLRC